MVAVLWSGSDLAGAEFDGKPSLMGDKTLSASETRATESAEVRLTFDGRRRPESLADTGAKSSENMPGASCLLPRRDPGMDLFVGVT